MNIPLMNPGAQYRALQPEIDAAIRQDAVGTLRYGS